MDVSHLNDALKHVAVELEQLAQERRPTEADLQVALGRKLQAAAAESGESVVVSEQERLSLDGWPGVGPVDLTIRLGEDSVAAAFVELKWGGGTLWNCVWDVAKLALAVRQGAARSGYLVAGAPTSEWEKPVRGVELFESRVRDIGDYMAVYADLFEFWRTEVATQPLRLPTPIATRRVGAVELSVDAQPWSVRIADIRPAGDDWSVTFRDGHETGRDRKDRFLTTDTTGRWIERPEQPAGEGVDESGSDRAFWTDVLGTDPLSDK